MEVKKDILWRVYLSFLGIVIFAAVILGRAVYIQQAEGAEWRQLAMTQQQRVVPIDAERGTIYSEDGNMLSTSIPYFDIYIDFAADGLRAKNGKVFKENVDSLSRRLAGFYKDRSSKEYKKQLQQGFAKKNRYFLLKKNIPFQEYKVLRTFPLLKLDPNRGGFIAEVKSKRLTPFGLLANRTIGLSREYLDEKGKIRTMNVGLEYTYDSVLKGERGERVVRKISPGVFVPIEGSEVDPENGKDIVTTLDVNIQDIAENALYKTMLENDCEYGTAIIMEVKTGKIKAMANLGKKSDGSYWEDLNYSIRASEPGSTFKLATMLALLEDEHVTLDSKVNLEGGKWKVNGRVVYDSESHGNGDFTLKHAFEVSSNVAMAKMAVAYYSKDPMQFVNHLRKLKLDQFSGIDLKGETHPVVKTPKSKTWSATSLPWMSFGYEVLVSPLQTLMLYNAVANDGRMMRPYLVNEVQKAGIAINSFDPETLDESIASSKTIRLLQECLNGVCQEEDGTGYTLFKGAPYKVAGKTGTALMANGNRGYADHIYQSSFAGYFPADEPKYSCIVVIRNKPFAKKYYGAAIAGPVFKEIADKLFALETDKNILSAGTITKKDSSTYLFAGNIADMRRVLEVVDWKFFDSSSKKEWGRMYGMNGQSVLRGQETGEKRMPDVRGMGLKDALFLLENMNVRVAAKGRGKVKQQSIEPGMLFNTNREVTIELN
ncbi:MAG: transpeptidase family protein [Chitinophagaceae bacterium]|nr:transpeptidase family protein [Chitinophagaceae bacterium]